MARGSRELKSREQEHQQQAASLTQMLASERFRKNLSKIMPNQQDAQRFAVIAMRQLSVNPSLMDCSAYSVVGSVMQAAALGLEIGVQGEAYLVPFRDRERGLECQLQIGYQGMLKLAWNSGLLSSIHADVVTKEEVEAGRFEWQSGSHPIIKHQPLPNRDPDDDRQIEYAYAVIRVKGSDYPIMRVLDARRINKLRNTGSSANSPAWRNHFGEMSMGKALKSTAKWAPRSTQQSVAIAMDDKVDGAVQQVFDIDEDLITTVTGLEPPIDVTPAPEAKAGGDPKPAPPAGPKGQGAEGKPPAGPKKGDPVHDDEPPEDDTVEGWGD